MMRLMTTMFAVGAAALHVAPTAGVVRPVIARRAAVLVMDEEADISVPLNTDITEAAADIKEVLGQEGFEVPAPSPEEAAKAAWLAATYGAPMASPVQSAPAAPATTEVVALTEEKNTLEAALEYGYDAEKVARLSEVEALLDGLGGPAPAEEAALSPEEAAKQAWLARNRRW